MPAEPVNSTACIHRAPPFLHRKILVLRPAHVLFGNVQPSSCSLTTALLKFMSAYVACLSSHSRSGPCVRFAMAFQMPNYL